MVCDRPINATVEAVDLRYVAARDRTDLRKAQVNWGRPSGRPFSLHKNVAPAPVVPGGG